MTKPMLTAELLKTLLDYDPATGVFVWKAPLSRRVKAGEEAGVVAANGRRYIGIDGGRYMAHHLAWLYVHGVMPDEDLAALNGDYLDVRISNLAPQTAAETARKGGHSREAGASGIKGVSWDAERGKWIASITRDYRVVRLGRYDTKEEAAAAYLAAADVRPAMPDRKGRTARAAEARVRYVNRTLWKRTIENAGGLVAWESMEAFLADVGTAPNDRQMLVALDKAAPIGPSNFAWVQKSEFDHSTPEGRAAYGKAHRAANPMLHKAHHLRKTFGLDVADYQAMLAAQNGVCAICSCAETEIRNGKVKALAVDHDHATGEVRSLLCHACNKAIGLMGDSVERLTAAIAYLKRHASNVVKLNPSFPDYREHVIRRAG